MEGLLGLSVGGVNLMATRKSKNPIISLRDLLIGFLIIKGRTFESGGKVRIVNRKKLADAMGLSLT